MTIASAARRIQYDGNDVTTSFPFPYLFFLDSHIVVVLTNTSGVDTTLTLDTHYTVAGAEDPSGGTITYPVSGDPLATGEMLTIYRTVPNIQDTDLSNQGAYFLEPLEDALDYITMAVQQLNDLSGLSLRLPETSGYSDLTIPDPEAGKYLKWKAALDGLENSALAITETEYDGTISAGADASKPGSPTTNDIYLAIDTKLVYVCFSSGTWIQIIKLNAYNLLKNGDMEKWSAGTSSAPDNWSVNLGTVARTTTKKRGTYAAELTSAGTVAQLIQNYTDYADFQGGKVILGVWVKCSTASLARLLLWDGVSITYSDYHTGSGNWEFLELTKTIAGTASVLQVQLRTEAAGNAIFDAVKLEEGELATPFSPHIRLGHNWFDPTDPDYGAVGDGIVDDAPAIQAAFDAANIAGAGKVSLPIGTFLINTQLQTYENVIFEGSGWGTTIKCGAEMLSMITDGVGAFADNIVIRNMQIDGADLAKNGIQLTDVTNYCICDNYIHNVGIDDPASNAAIITTGNSGFIERNYIKDINYNARGIWVTSHKSFSTHVNKNFIDNCFVGITLEDQVYLNWVENNTVINSRNNGISVNVGSIGGAETYASEVFVRGNICYDNAANGIVFQNGAGGAIISENQCAANTSSGIYVVNNTASCDNTIIANNRCWNNGLDGLRIDNTENVVITGNRCWDDQGVKTQDYGLRLQGTSDNLTITGNDFTGNKDAGMALVGSSNIIRNNKGWVTENSGTGRITGGTTINIVNHGLATTPSAEHIRVIGKENPTNSVGTIWVDTITATQFTVNVENDPGASHWDYGWAVAIY